MSHEIASLRAVRSVDFEGFRVLPFVPGDYAAVYELLQAHQPGSFTVPDPWAAGKAYRDLGPCWTGWVESQGLNGVTWNPLLCAGLSDLGHGLAEAWALLSPAFKVDRVARHWFKAQMRQRIPILMGELDCQRLEANVRAGGLVFARSLGFTMESHMPRWVRSGEGFFKFVRFRGGEVG